MLVICLATPAFAVVVVLNSPDADVNVAALIFTAALLYAIEVVICLAIAPAFIPREIKDEWEHRQLRETAERRRK